MPFSRMLKNQRGATLMIVLVLVVIVGLSAGIAGSTWKTVMQRAREEQLLWVGEQYRRAIESYVSHRGVTGQAGGGGIQSIRLGQSDEEKNRAAAFLGYPNSLEDLLKDPRSLQTVRHIRRLYKDPMTGEDFELVLAPGNRIKGVRSTSKEEPFKKDGFPAEYDNFKDADSYQKWEFVYSTTSSATRNSTSGASGGTPTPPGTTSPNPPGGSSSTLGTSD